MVILHIKLKGITKCSNIVANILPADPSPSSRHYPRRWGQKVKVQLFQNMAMLHIKFKGITNYTNIVANILPADAPPQPHPSLHQPRQIQPFQNMAISYILHITNNEIHFADNELN